MHGQIGAVQVGKLYTNREECRHAGVHRAPVAGIAGYGGAQPAESVVVAGGYEDDTDYDDLIIYTGEGGNDPGSGKQIRDQEMTKGNLGLTRNIDTGIPVRVVRSASATGKGGPYRYDGLFLVTGVARQKGKSDFFVFRYRLEKLSEPTERPIPSLPTGTTEPERRSTTTQRVVRQTAISNAVKRLHDYVCQFCSTRISIPTGGYAEAAHIKPLGRPHDGPDVSENVLCLCANCHVLFDRGAIGVAADGSLINTPGELRVVAGHQVGAIYLEYHLSQHDL
jgi:putative restriction endonuclease